MAFNRPSLEELNTRTDTQLASRLGIAAFLRRSVLGVVSRVLAGASHLLHGHISWAFKQLFPDTAETTYLDRWASIWGIDRKTAAVAEGYATLVLTAPAVIPIGTLLQTAAGVRYETTELIDAETLGNTAVAVKATETGEAGNTSSPVVANLLSPIAGVSSAGTITSAAGGTSDEADSQLRSRLLARIELPPHGGAESDYEMWALEVPDITRAWVFPENTGAGTVGVSVVVDDLVGGPIPDGAKIAEVQAHLEEVRPVTAIVTAFAPVAAPIDPTIELVPNNATVQAAVEASLQDMLKREAVPGGTILLSHIREAISIAAGETDHDLVSPVADVTASTGELITLGAITWQG